MEGLELGFESSVIGDSAGAPSPHSKDKKRRREEKHARKEEKRAKKEQKANREGNRRREAVDAMMELSREKGGAWEEGWRSVIPAVGEVEAELQQAGASSSKAKKKKKVKEKKKKEDNKETEKKKKKKDHKETGKNTSEENNEEKKEKSKHLEGKKRKRTEDDEQEGEGELPLAPPPHSPTPTRTGPVTPITYKRKERARASPSLRDSSSAAGPQIRASPRKANAATAKAKTPTKTKTKANALSFAPSLATSPSADPESSNAVDNPSNGPGSSNPFTKAKRQRSDTGRALPESKYDAASLRERFRTPGAMEEWLACQFVNKNVLVDLEKQGILTLKRGKISGTEAASVRKAVNDFAKVNRMNEDEITDQIMMKSRDGGSKEERRDLWMAIAAAAPGRPIPLLQPMVRRMYDPRGHKGPWTREEDQQLLRAFDLYPNQWRKIASIVERTESDCRDRYIKELSAGDDRSTGRWTANEEARLAECVRRVMKEMQDMRDARAAGGDDAGEGEEGGEVKEKDVPWAAVAKEVGTRSMTQCRIKWRDAFGTTRTSARAATGPIDSGDVKDRTLRIIKRLQALGYRSEKHIDWRVVRDDTLEHVSGKDIRNAYSNCKRLVLRNVPEETIAFKDLLSKMREHTENYFKRKNSRPLSQAMIDDSYDG